MLDVYDPWLKCFFTDFTSDHFSSQYFGRCANLELKFLDCMEAYGLYKGLQKCEDLLADYKECVYKRKQFDRIVAMRNERNRQWHSGERSKENRFAPGPRDDVY